MTDTPWPYTGIGCDATNGGEHSIIREGTYAFCSKCGETVRAKRKPARGNPAAIKSSEPT